MDADFSEKLKAVLSDPDAMAKITAIASGLGREEPSDMPKEPLGINALGSDKPNLTMPSLQSGDPRLALLVSLKPLLREDRRDRVDALAQALTLASVMKNFRK
ncbi:MAG: hypothetical protein IIW39_02240 [Clostridia bacterium]|nr:hypothetical protein [Clostridia bacterium]